MYCPIGHEIGPTAKIETKGTRRRSHYCCQPCQVRTTLLFSNTNSYMKPYYNPAFYFCSLDYYDVRIYFEIHAIFQLRPTKITERNKLLTKISYKYLVHPHEKSVGIFNFLSSKFKYSTQKETRHFFSSIVFPRYGQLACGRKYLFEKLTIKLELRNTKQQNLMLLLFRENTNCTRKNVDNIS